jgi:hypothetical protein
MVVLLAGGELASELHKGTGAIRTRAGHLFDGRISNGGPTDSASVEHVERVVSLAGPEPRSARPAPGRAPAREPALLAPPARAD